MKKENAPAMTVASPSRMKIQALAYQNQDDVTVPLCDAKTRTHAGFPPIPSILEIAAANKPL